MPAAKLVRAEQWLPSAEAAAFLGVSIRELQRKKKRYGFRTNQVAGPSGSLGTVYHAGDLAEFRENGAGTALAVREPGVGLAVQPGGFGVQAEALRAIADHFRGRVEPKLWMTVQEAAAYTGLPVGFLRRRVAEGLGMNVGLGSRRRIMISRRELDALAEAQA